MEKETDILRKTSQLRQQMHTVSAEFVRIELGLAATFCQVALATNDASKARRNLDHAQRAYSAACKFARRIKSNGNAHPTKAEESRVKELIARARSVQDRA